MYFRLHVVIFSKFQRLEGRCFESVLGYNAINGKYCFIHPKLGLPLPSRAMLIDDDTLWTYAHHGVCRIPEKHDRTDVNNLNYLNYPTTSNHWLDLSFRNWLSSWRTNMATLTYKISLKTSIIQWTKIQTKMKSYKLKFPVKTLLYKDELFCDIL